jgi:hypothetical protein
VKKKKKAAPRPKKSHSPPRPRSGTKVLGRVNPDLVVIVPDLNASELRGVADSLSKAIEVTYQMELIRRSGFGQPEED